jgi:hypothetical protein
MVKSTSTNGEVPAAPFYARPAGTPLQLGRQPRLASWNARDHPDQVRLAAALADASGLLQPALDTLEEPIVLRLDIGLPSATPLLDEHDLDNYAFPSLPT